jgi:hypothetical protein
MTDEQRRVRKQAELPVVPAPLGLVEPSEGPSPIREEDWLPCCGACGKKIAPDEEHDDLACWDKMPCRGCGEVHGYNYDHDRLLRICKGCGHERDML